MGRNFLRGFALVWLILAAMLMAVGYARIFWTEGWWAMMAVMPSPFNISSFIVTVITISPALGAWWLADYLGRRGTRSTHVLRTIGQVGLAGFLVYGLILTMIGVVIKGMALATAVVAVLGPVWGILVLLFSLELWLPLLAMPALLYGVLLIVLFSRQFRAVIPARHQRWALVVMFIGFPLMAEAWSYSVSMGIGWVADQNPCAAFAAGVTGSRPPVNCP
jgi:hypothetical protein